MAALIGFKSVRTEESIAHNPLSNSEKVVGDIITDQDVPLFSGSVVYGDLIFVSGKGAHFEPELLR